VLVNNAGSMAAIGPIWEVDPDDWWSDVRTSLWAYNASRTVAGCAARLCTSSAAPMAERGCRCWRNAVSWNLNPQMLCSTLSASCTMSDQRLAFELRAKTTAPAGVLLLQFHSLLTIVSQGQWNALRHGHFAYYSLTALTELLDAPGMSVATAWEFDLCGGTVLVTAVHGRVESDERVSEILQRERGFGITDPAVVGRLQRAAESQATQLRNRLEAQAGPRRKVYGYGAASLRCSALRGSTGGSSRRSPTRCPRSRGAGCLELMLRASHPNNSSRPVPIAYCWLFRIYTRRSDEGMPGSTDAGQSTLARAGPNLSRASPPGVLEREAGMGDQMHEVLTLTDRDVRSLYLDLIRRDLTRYGIDELVPVRWPLLRTLVKARDLMLVRKRPFDQRKRDLGQDHPADAETMMGTQIPTSLQRCVQEIL
jgi:hypothetical protein